MDDEKIIALYWQRDESAITATDAKYGARCRAALLPAARTRRSA